MQLWFFEEHTPEVKLAIKVTGQLYHGQSEFQKIAVFDSKELGRILTLDGFIMLTEKDEFIYHEMITHVPLAVHPQTEKVLVIGGGDGGTIRELTAYQDIQQIDLVEIDRQVVEVCKKYLPQTSKCLNDRRVKIYFQDGLNYVKEFENHYDVIIVDSTDPFGPGESLFSQEFYDNCFKALKTDGIMINQHESPFYNIDVQAMQNAHQKIAASFPISQVYQAHIPTYSSGHWLFGFASKKYLPVDDLKAVQWNLRQLKTRYYNTKLHAGAFALPNYVLDLLQEVE